MKIDLACQTLGFPTLQAWTLTLKLYVWNFSFEVNFPIFLSDSQHYKLEIDFEALTLTFECWNCFAGCNLSYKVNFNFFVFNFLPLEIYMKCENPNQLTTFPFFRYFSQKKNIFWKLELMVLLLFFFLYRVVLLTFKIVFLVISCRLDQDLLGVWQKCLVNRFLYSLLHQIQWQSKNSPSKCFSINSLILWLINYTFFQVMPFWNFRWSPPIRL